MHSSRMRTGRSLTVCRSLLPGLGGVCSRGCLLWGVSAPGGVCSGRCLLWGGVCSWGCLLWEGVCSWGVSAPGGCLLWGDVLLQGVSALGGVCSGGCGIPACTEADTPPVNRMTDRCKNITLATTSLRPVINEEAEF